MNLSIFAGIEVRCFRLHSDERFSQKLNGISCYFHGVSMQFLPLDQLSNFMEFDETFLALAFLQATNK